MGLKEKLFWNKKDWIGKLANLSNEKEYGSKFLNTIIFRYMEKEVNFRFSSEERSESPFFPVPAFWGYLRGDGDNSSLFGVDKFGVFIHYDPFNIRPYRNEKYDSYLFIRKPFGLKLNEYTEKDNQQTIKIFLNKKETKFRILDERKNNFYQSLSFEGNFVEGNLKYLEEDWNPKLNLPLEVISPYFKLYDLIRKDVEKLK